MDTECIKRVVIAKRMLDLDGCNITDGTCDDAQNERTRWIDEASSRGNRNQACNSTRNNAKNTWLTGNRPFRKHPGESRTSGRNLRVEHGNSCKGVCTGS